MIVEFKGIFPYEGDPRKYKAAGRIDVDNLEMKMPYLAKALANSTYNKSQGWISFRRGHKIVTIHKSGLVTMIFVNSREEAIEILEYVERVASRISGEVQAGENERTLIGVLDVYTYLPKSNCKKCGEQTCMAFAVKLLNEEKKLGDCKPLFDKRFSKARKKLELLLAKAGYKI